VTNAHDAIHSAFAHHEAGDLDAAEALYAAVLADEPENLNGLQLLGLVMHQRGHTAEAVMLLQKAIAVLESRGQAGAQHAALYGNLGTALRAAGRTREAVAQHRRGLDLDPTIAALHANLGNALLADGDPQGGIASLEAARQLGPLPADCLRNLAAAYHAVGSVRAERGDNPGAIDALRRCLETDVRHAGALYRLGAVLASVGLLDLAISMLETAAAVSPDDARVFGALGNALQAQGKSARALACFRHACALAPLITWPAARQPADYSVLLIQAPGVANTPPEFLLGGAGGDCFFYPLLPGAAPDFDMLRRHGDIVVNLISDADQGGAILTTAAGLVDRLGKRAINHPRRILDTGRDAIGKRLAGIPHCHVPVTVRLSRAQLAVPDVAAVLMQHGPAFPLLLRIAGTHGGEAFEKIDCAADVAKFLDQHHEAADFYASTYVDYRSIDGCFRKYRFVFIGKEILPYHLAIGNVWKVHHYTTEMDRHPWMQEEEKSFLDRPGAVFSPAHYDALQAIRAAIDLEFFGIDCSLDRDGNVVVFEVNASILIHDDNAQFPYKTPHCRRIKAAFEAMLAHAAKEAKAATGLVAQAW
jgi:tetratricopeptide (TPR) repeat protein